MTTRITGTNSGLDVDSLVTSAMQPYKAKVDKEVQNQKVLQYQQEQYKQIMSDASGFYDKYCDILKTGNLMSTSTYNTVSFTSGDPSKVTAKGFAGADVSNYSVSVTQLASKATIALTTSELNASLGQSASSLTLTIGGKTVNFNIAKDATTGKVDTTTTTSALNTALTAAGVNVSAKYSQFSDGIVIESGNLGASQVFDVNGLKDSTATAVNKHAQGSDIVGTINNAAGGSYALTGTSNTVTVDNIQFSFKGVTKSSAGIDTPVILTGATNVTDLKDKIVGFVNDYNTLLQSINTKIYETRDKDYMPLTDDQKKSMTDSQITAWEKKAQTGLLRKDNDLQRIANEMKSAMSTVMSGSGTYLEKIGISPVKNYAEKNGMLTIDENKLTTALQDNATNVKDLFTRASSTTDKGGIITQISSILNSEFKTSSSSLSKKAGLDGTITQYSNILTKSIANKTTLIATLNSSLTTKETALYKKYSDLDTVMGKLNSQQSSLKSMLGQA